MSLDLTTVVKDVRVVLDENVALSEIVDSNGNPYDNDTLQLDEIIKSKLADGLNAIRRVAPISLLKCSNTTAPTTAASTITLPATYMRFVKMTAPEWKKPVMDLSVPSDTFYNIQSSEFAGIHGNASRPVACMSVASSGSVIELYPKAKATLYYIPRVSSVTTSTEIEAGIYRSFLHEVAAQVLIILRQYDVSAMLTRKALELAGIELSNEQ